MIDYTIKKSNLNKLKYIGYTMSILILKFYIKLQIVAQDIGSFWW